MSIFNAELEPYRAEARRFFDQLRRTGAQVRSVATPELVLAARQESAVSGADEPSLAPEIRTLATPGGEIPMRVFVPSEPRAVFLNLHGGGFCLGSAEEDDVPNARIAQQCGVVIVSIEYRLAPEHPFPAALDDSDAVLSWIVEHRRDEFGVDRVIVGGGSAGANLSLGALLRLRDRGESDPVIGAWLCAGGYDLSMTPSQRQGIDTLVVNRRLIEELIGHYAPGRDREERRDPSLSPLYADLRGLPPALFLAAEQDLLIDDTLFMEARWRAAGNDTELIVFPACPHGFTLWPIPMTQVLWERTQDWIRRRVAATEPAVAR